MQSEPTQTILIAEDEPSLITVYEAWLSDEFELRTAQDGREAIAQLSDDVDVLICDRQMPHVTGDEVVAKLNADGREIPVIIVSSCRPDATLGKDDVECYLMKPVDQETVSTAIRQVLG